MQVRWRPGGRRDVCVLLGGDGGPGNSQVAGESGEREGKLARVGRQLVGSGACGRVQWTKPASLMTLAKEKESSGQASRLV